MRTVKTERDVTLIDVLKEHAAKTPDRLAFTFAGQTHTYAQLWQGVQSLAAGFGELSLQGGGTVVMALPNSVEFFHAFYGTQLAGGVAVPVFPGSGVERILNISDLCSAKHILVPSTLPASRLSKLKQRARGAAREILTPEGVKDDPAGKSFPTPDPDGLAYLQYTSGSTGHPKGVMLTHRNIMENVWQMVAGMEITAEEIFVSWLPVYHDMGLILKTMVPFTIGAVTHLLPTDLKDIDRWFGTIEATRATFTAAPDFAYRLALRHLQKDKHYDLASLRVALNAAEPVRQQTMQDFHERFNLQDVMVAGYGLAEATVGVSMWKPGTANRVDEQGFVSVGRPFPGVQISILREGKIAAANQVGEILVDSPAKTRGYYEQPGDSDNLFWADGSIRTGDMGYLDKEGYLFIVGRLKNTIKIAGRTVYAQEVEEVVDRVDGVRYSAAVGIDRSRLEGEQVYVFAEIRDSEHASTSDLEDTLISIIESFYEHMGFRPGRVYLLKPKTIPLTHNGKIQHLKLKESYLNGSLAAKHGLLYPEY